MQYVHIVPCYTEHFLCEAQTAPLLLRTQDSPLALPLGGILSSEITQEGSAGGNHGLALLGEGRSVL